MIDEVVQRAPELADTVDEGDEIRRLPDATWEELLTGGFLRALQPKRWGGGEVTVLEFFDGTFELANARVGGLGRQRDRGAPVATGVVPGGSPSGDVGR